MDDSVRRAMARWPNVPALHGWLRLDTRGRWLIRDEPVTHHGLIDFIGRNYLCDERGRWYFQNGPQRVFVSLDYTPWVLQVDNGGHLRTHTGSRSARVEAALIDDAGDLVLVTELGAGLVDTDALVRVCDWFEDDDGGPLDADGLAVALERLQHGHAGACRIRYGDSRAALAFVPRADVPARLGYIDRPQAD